MNSVGRPKPKCVYIVSENASLDTNTGAGTHVQTGIAELKKVFEVELVLFCKPYVDLGDDYIQPKIKNSTGVYSLLKRIYGRWLKWWTILLKNHIHFTRFFRLIKKGKPQVIYERAAYLNFNGLIISKILGLPHYYEVNGLYFKDNASRFASIYNWIAKLLERVAYKSTNGFYVGGLNEELKLPESSRVHVIQNGVSEQFLNNFSETEYRKQIADSTLNIVFVGHLMPHHRLDFLLKAMSGMNNKNKVTLHLVGSNFEKMEREPEDYINIVNHGVLKNAALRDVLKTMDAGIVPFALDYYSNMKLFLYAASRLVLIIPRTRNFRRLFSEDEAMFFDNGNVQQLSDILDELINSREKYNSITQNAFRKVQSQYTWPLIFDSIIKEMDRA